MSRSITQSISFVLAGLAVLHAAQGGQPAEKPTRAEFMRQKLVFAKDVLEGLTLERFPMVETGGKALKTLSNSAQWETPTIPNANDYVMMTTDFQRQCDDLVKQAKAKNIDGATLAYVKLTMTCVECHKFVRDVAK